MTNTLAYDRQQHRALEYVARDQVLFHTLDHPGGTGGFNRTAPGSGKIPVDLFVSLSTLYRTEMVQVLPARGLGDRVDHTRQVTLTGDGAQLLDSWGVLS